MALACRLNGFCGGSGGHVLELIGGLERLDGHAFARIVLAAEDWPPERVEYETRWLEYFEEMFRDVFGNGEIELGPA